MNESELPPGVPRPGDEAPGFTLRNEAAKKVSLEDLLTQPVVLAFYPADFSPVCGDQLSLYQERLGEFEERGARLVGISIDHRWSHAAYAEARGLTFTLLSDFHPKGEVARAYGVYREDEGLARRSLFVIDPAGVIRWSYIAPPRTNPGVEGIFAALDALE